MQKSTCSHNHIKAHQSLILLAPEWSSVHLKTPKNPASQNPSKKQKNSQDYFQVPQRNSNHFAFESLRGPAFSCNASWKAAHASVKHQSQNSLPLFKNTPSLDAFLCSLNKTRISDLYRSSAVCRHLNMSPAAHFAKASFQTLNLTMPFSLS